MKEAGEGLIQYLFKQAGHFYSASDSYNYNTFLIVQMKLNFKTFGQGEPLIILHGLFGTLDNWQTLAKQFAENYLVYIVDQRNHGRSPHVDTINYPAMAEDLRVFMEENWIHQAHVLGHSMGGKTAMQFAFDFPDMVDKLIVVDIAPKAYVGGHQAIFDALFSMDLSTIDNRKAAEEQLLTKVEDVGTRQFLLKNLTRNKEGQYRWKMNLSVLYQDYQDILAAIMPDPVYDGPTLFIRGGASNYIADSYIPTLHQLFSDVKVETVADAGHWVHAQSPKELRVLVESFLEGA